VVLAVLEREGVEGAFDVVVSPVLRACDALAVAASRCALAGDSTADVEAAVAAGMVAVGLTGGMASAEELRAAGATAVVDRLDDAVAVLTAPQASEVR
jgi:phosphoglycolate phosphatase-like HAD superfamily hydrolase